MATLVSDNCKGVRKSVSKFTNNICQIMRRFHGHDDLKESVEKTNSISQVEPGIHGYDNDLKENLKETESASCKFVSVSSVPKSVSDFTNDLCKILTKNIEENYICSSLSAHVALSMAAYGADNNTAEELKKVLYISDNDSELLENYQKLSDVLINKQNIVPNDTGSINGMLFESEYETVKKQQPSIAILANKIFISKDTKVRHQYENLMETYFRSKSESLDFSDSVKSVDIVNKWCSDVTNGKINTILNSNDISSCTALILINAVYFKAYWLHEFKTEQLKTFYLSTSNEIKVPTMYLEKKLYYKNLQDLNAQAVRLDFMGGDQYMEVIVPNEIDGLETIQQNFDKVNDKKFEPIDIRFWLPKFKIETSIDFTEHLKKLGIVEAFDETMADFNKICNSKIFIQKVLQKAYIKVDKFGCEAAAITADLIVCRRKVISQREPTIVKADRPFLFIIKDARIEIPLFVGAVINPQ